MRRALTWGPSDVEPRVGQTWGRGARPRGDGSRWKGDLMVCDSVWVWGPWRGHGTAGFLGEALLLGQ